MTRKYLNNAAGRIEFKGKFSGSINFDNEQECLSALKQAATAVIYKTDKKGNNTTEVSLEKDVKNFLNHATLLKTSLKPTWQSELRAVQFDNTKSIFLVEDNQTNVEQKPYWVNKYDAISYKHLQEIIYCVEDFLDFAQTIFSQQTTLKALKKYFGDDTYQGLVDKYGIDYIKNILKQSLLNLVDHLFTDDEQSSHISFMIKFLISKEIEHRCRPELANVSNDVAATDDVDITVEQPQLLQGATDTVEQPQLLQGATDAVEIEEIPQTDHSTTTDLVSEHDEHDLVEDQVVQRRKASSRFQKAWNFFKKYLAEPFGVALSTGIGAGAGALIFGLIFPVVGAPIGALFGAATGLVASSMGVGFSRLILTNHFASVFLGTVLTSLSAGGLGAFLGFIAGTIFFPGVGSLLGAGLGTGLAVALNLSFAGLAHIVKASQTPALIFGVAAIITGTVGIGATVGAIMGTLVFPGLGTGMGALIGAGIAASAIALVSAAVALISIPFVVIKAKNTKASPVPGPSLYNNEQLQMSNSPAGDYNFTYNLNENKLATDALSLEQVRQLNIANLTAKRVKDGMYTFANNSPKPNRPNEGTWVITFYTECIALNQAWPILVDKVVNNELYCVKASANSSDSRTQKLYISVSDITNQEEVLRVYRLLKEAGIVAMLERTSKNLTGEPRLIDSNNHFRSSGTRMEEKIRQNQNVVEEDAEEIVQEQGAEIRAPVLV